MNRFVIVTPTFQSDAWLDQAIHSIAGQEGLGRPGGFTVRLRIQDGGSTDGTMEIVARWRAALAAGVVGKGLTLSAEQAPDAGMYDAIMRGFDALEPEPGEIMTWLNSDDLLAPGALAAVASCLTELPEVSLVGGRVCMIDAQGRVLRVNAPVALSQKLVAAGLHDGRRMPFVMQEGTFWRSELWSRVGGLDTRFKLAGDWDLWRRMTRHTPFVTMDVLTGFHRRRPGQLSENLDAYYAELARFLTGSAQAPYDQVYADYVAAGSATGGQAFAGFEGPIAQLDRDALAWGLTHRYGERLAPSVVQTPAGRTQSRRGGVLSGAKGFEGPYPEWDLPGGIRWITERHARLSIPTDEAGPHEVRLTCRPGASDLAVTIRAGAEVVHHAVIDPLNPVRDQVLAFDLWSAGGDLALDLETVTPHGDPENRLLVIDLIVTPRERPEARAPGAGGAHVVIEAGGRPQGLAATLASLTRRDGAGPVVSVEGADGDPVTAAVLEAWRPMLSRDAPGSADVRLTAGTRLAPGGLTALVAGMTGASREIDGRGLAWLRPAPAGAARVTDEGLTVAPPRASEGARMRLLRILAADADPDDALGRMLARMDAEVRIHTLAAQSGEAALEAEIKGWLPHAVLGGRAALAVAASAGASGAWAGIVQDDALSGLAQAAEAALSVTARSRAAARALLDLGGEDRVWAVASSDAARAARAAGTAGGTLLAIGDGPVTKVGDRRLVRVGAADGPDLLSWALSAADGLIVTAATPVSLRLAGRALGLKEEPLGEVGPLDPAPLHAFAAGLLERTAAAGEARDGLARALRFRRVDEVSTRLAAGEGARKGALGLEIAGQGSVLLTAIQDGPVRLRLTTSAKTLFEVRMIAAGETCVVPLDGEGSASVAAFAGRPVRVRIDTGSARRSVRVTLADAPAAPGAEAARSAAWEAREGFGREEPASAVHGLDAPFRWIEGRSARLAVFNDKAGWKRLTLRLRSLTAEQRVMIRAGGRTVGEATLEGGDLKRPGSVSATVRLPKGWSEVDLRFSAPAVMPDRMLAAIVDGVSLGSARTERSVPGSGWTDIDGFDFEEPPAPQYGLETAFRWRLAGCRIAVAGDRPGRHHVVIRYRTALAGQTVIASARSVELARHTAEHARLDADEVLAFDVDLRDEPLEIALDADAFMQGDRPLGFIIQSVSVQPTL